MRRAREDERVCFPTFFIACLHITVKLIKGFHSQMHEETCFFSFEWHKCTNIGSFPLIVSCYLLPDNDDESDTIPHNVTVFLPSHFKLCSYHPFSARLIHGREIQIDTLKCECFTYSTRNSHRRKYCVVNVQTF